MSLPQTNVLLRIPGLGVQARKGAEHAQTLPLKPSRPEPDPQAQRRQARRMRQVRDREFDALRQIRLRSKKKASGSVGESLPGSGALFPGSTPHAGSSGSTGPTTPSQPLKLLDGPQMVRLINELEVIVLSEAMERAGRTPKRSPFSALDSSLHPAHGLPRGSPAFTSLIDDAALMVAAHQWGYAAELLASLIGEGDSPMPDDWVRRSAIDLFERCGQSARASDLRTKYRQELGRLPRRIIAPRLTCASSGLLRTCKTPSWQCPSQLDSAALTQLRLHLRSGKVQGWPVVLDWSHMGAVEGAARHDLRHTIEDAMRMPSVHLHAGLAGLMRAARTDLLAQRDSRPSWRMWLTLLNWSGLRRAHHTASLAFVRELHCPQPAYVEPQCIGKAVELPADRRVDNHIFALNLQGDLSEEHTHELRQLRWPTLLPGALVLLDCRRLSSVDFLFGAELLNCASEHHAIGHRVVLTSAHPLLAQFLRMLGLHTHASFCNGS